MLEQVVNTFNELFYPSFRTLLIGGNIEPEYLPATSSDTANRIHFREDFLASALHEAAHWCLTGPERRKNKDYGYWYDADGRNEEQQIHFMEAEARPQALEKIFHQACKSQLFHASMDNLDSPLSYQLMAQFNIAIDLNFRTFRKNGLPNRAKLFERALHEI